MTTLTAIALAASMLAAAPAFADVAMTKKLGCAGCHDASAEKLGPTWKDIQTRNKGSHDAMTILVNAIDHGTKGNYGKFAMPPQPMAKDAAPALAKWIMTN